MLFGSAALRRVYTGQSAQIIQEKDTLTHGTFLLNAIVQVSETLDQANRLGGSILALAKRHTDNGPHQAFDSTVSLILCPDRIDEK